MQIPWTHKNSLDTSVQSNTTADLGSCLYKSRQQVFFRGNYSSVTEVDTFWPAVYVKSRSVCEIQVSQQISVCKDHHHRLGRHSSVQLSNQSRWIMHRYRVTNKSHVWLGFPLSGVHQCLFTLTLHHSRDGVL